MADYTNKLLDTISPKKLSYLFWKWGGQQKVNNTIDIYVDTNDMWCKTNNTKNAMICFSRMYTEQHHRSLSEANSDHLDTSHYATYSL